MRVLTACLAFTLAAFWAAGAAAAVYKCPGPDGKPVFTDLPCPGGETVDVTPAMVFTAPPLPAADEESAEEAAEESPYELVRIIRPTPEETIWTAEGRVNIQLDVRPALERGHQFQVVLDGMPQGITATSLNISITGVERGKHTLRIDVVDRAGKRLNSSAVVTFFLQAPDTSRPQRPGERPPWEPGVQPPPPELRQYELPGAPTGELPDRPGFERPGFPISPQLRAPRNVPPPSAP